MTRRRLLHTPAVGASSADNRRRVTISEDTIRKAAIKLAKSLGGLHKRMHFGPGATVGWPDDLFMFPTHSAPRMCWIEFKASGKRAEPIQIHTHELMREYGQRVYVCNSIEQVRYVFAVISAACSPSFECATGFPIIPPTAVH